ncbi:MAG TPA: M48 family metalloprotease, partial [Desulfosarcina sp.]|nr:M48 family metalloprotease [Desulfosarcina sp.]
KRTRREFLQTAGKCALGLGAAPALSCLFSGCAEMGGVAAIGSQIAASTGLINQQQAQSIARGATAMGKAFEDITPEQEYYIGRTIGAVILKKYPAYPDRRVNDYVNTLGQGLAMVSDMPETYAGSHFLVLDSDDINALSAPGGFVFITRGLLRCCTTEDAAAAVLAHEIGHVQFKHGLRAIKSSRLTEAFAIIGVESAKSLGGAELANLTSIFEDSIKDITHTLVDTGYARSLEYEADEAAVTIMKRIGYDPNALVEMLREMKKRLVPGRGDFFATHPEPESRIDEAQEIIGHYMKVTVPKSRERRFEQALRKI